jgi:hypothetical protein
MLFRAAASKLTLLLLAVLATAVESADITTAATKNAGPTSRKLDKSKSKKSKKGKRSEIKDVARTVTCDEYAEYSMHMTMHYMDILISSFDLNAIQDATQTVLQNMSTARRTPS